MLQLQFLGAAQEVTGSCYLLKVGDHSPLVECGLIQGAPEDEARNVQPFPFDISTIDAVVLTHAKTVMDQFVPQLDGKFDLVQMKPR